MLHAHFLDKWNRRISYSLLYCRDERYLQFVLIPVYILDIMKLTSSRQRPRRKVTRSRRLTTTRRPHLTVDRIVYFGVWK